MEVGLTNGPDLDLEEEVGCIHSDHVQGTGRRRSDLLHRSFELNRDLASFPLFIISDWCLSALITICN